MAWNHPEDKKKINCNSVYIYQPPKNQSSKGTVNTITQQSRWLLNTGITPPRHTTFTCRIQREGHLLLVAGNFNERTSEGSLLNNIIKTSRLINKFPFLGIQAPTSTRGPHMLDCMLSSPSLVSHISAHNIESRLSGTNESSPTYSVTVIQNSPLQGVRI
jgi:hypothetical protein